MNLSELKFVVDSSQLLSAKKAITELGVAVSNLNKITKEEMQSAINSEKVKQEQSNSLTKASKAAEADAKAQIARQRATKGADDATRASTTVLERQQAILEFMTQGYSKGQASVLAYAKANRTVATDMEELGRVLDVQRKLMGNTPFDKSMSGLVALKNQYGEVREAIRQYNADSGLSSNQTRELARDKERIIEKLKQEGAGLTQIKQAIREYNSAYIETANKVNSLSKVEKDRERSMRDTANAARNVQAAEERLFATVSHLGDAQSNNIKVNERAALAIGSYERNLRLAGITGEEAALKLAKFKAAQEQVSAAEAKNRANYVARGVGVQLGDVGVSLASGMNPLTVAIQQGDQLRSIIQQSGLEATQMAGIMQQAFKGIVTSFKDVGIAMGAFVGGGIKSVGNGIANLVNKFVDIDNAALKVAETMIKFGVNQEAALNAAVNSLGAIRVAYALLGTVAIAAVTSIAIAMYKNAKATDEMMLKLTTSGATLNMTSKELEAFANNSNIAGISANTLKLSLAELASEGFKNKESLDALTVASQKYAIVTGKDLVDVMKNYAAVAKDPVKELIELGKATGNVTAETVKQVASLIESGNTAEATKIAIEAYAAAQVKAAEDIEKNLSPLSLLYIDLKTQASDAWDAISDIANSTSLVNDIRNITRIILGLVTAMGDVTIVASTAANAMKSPWNASTLFESMKEDLRLWNETAKDRQALLAGENRIGGTGSNGKNTSAEIALEEKLLNLREKTYTDLEKHNISLAKYDSLRREATIAYADNEEKRKAVLSEIAIAEEKEITKFNEKHAVKEKKQNAELNRLKELAAYYNLLATGKSGTTEYSQDYNKKKDDLSKLLASKQISGEAFAFGMNELEQNQPWYKDYIKHQEAIRDQDLATKDFTRTLEQQQETQLLGIKNSISSIGLTEEQKLVNEALQKVEEDRIKNLERIADLTDRASKSKTMSPEELKNYNKTLLEAEKKAYDERKALVAQGVKDSYDASHSFAAGWDTAFASYTDAAKNAADTGKMLFQRMTDGMTDAIVQFVTTGKVSFRDFANSVIVELIRIQARAMATQLLGNSSSGLFGALLGAIGIGGSKVDTSWLGNAPVSTPAGFSAGTLGSGITLSANGNAFTNSGLVNKFANGGTFTNSIVNKTTPFMFANGGKFGVMGEAGPEAILPLQRTRGGQLGVVASGGASSNVTVNVTVASDGSSKTEVSPTVTGKQFGDAIAAAVQSEIIKQKRNGGLLAA